MSKNLDTKYNDGRLNYAKDRKGGAGPAKLKVVEVDGEKIRNTIDPDFTMGGNPSRYAYVPLGELWIDRVMTAKDKLSTIMHEQIEHELMLSGLSYEEAHDRATAFEIKYTRNESEELSKMAISDLKPGGRVHEDGSGESSYNYDHILGPEHIAEGYSLSIKENYPHNFSVHLHHSGQEQGKLRVSTPSDNAYLKETVIYNKDHHNKGLGKAMLEAAYAHLAHVMKIPTVIGPVHSTSSHLVHESIKRKHGLEYKGGNPNLEVAQSAKKWKKMKPEPYDNRYGEYEVELFKALEDIPVGSPKQIGGQYESYDYSHMVPEPLRGKFSIELSQESWPHSPMYSHELHSKIYLHEDGRRFLVGAVLAMKRKTGDVVKISDANIKAPYRKLGLGLAAYESLLGHAVNKMGVKFVRGGTHSSSAEAVHRKLAEKHGFEYVVNPNPHTENVPEGDYDEKFLPYIRRIAKEDLNKALKDVPVGEYKENERGTKMWHYNHVLPQHLYDQGFRLYIDKNHTIWGSGDGWDGWVAKLHLFDKSSGIPLLRRIGIVEGRMSKMTPTDFIIDYANIQGSKGNPKGQDFNDFPMDDNIQENRSADIDKLDFRGRGLGPLMYEALMAHAKNYLGASYARGTSHSSMASGAHKKVAAKHGLDYKPVENPPEFQQKNSTGSFDDKYSDYRYELKSEMNLNKAIKDLRPG